MPVIKVIAQIKKATCSFQIHGKSFKAVRAEGWPGFCQPLPNLSMFFTHTQRTKLLKEAMALWADFSLGAPTAVFSPYSPFPALPLSPRTSTERHNSLEGVRDLSETLGWISETLCSRSFHATFYGETEAPLQLLFHFLQPQDVTHSTLSGLFGWF